MNLDTGIWKWFLRSLPFNQSICLLFWNILINPFAFFWSISIKTDNHNSRKNPIREIYLSRLHDLHPTTTTLSRIKTTEVLSQESGQDIRVLSQDPGQDIRVLSQELGQDIRVLSQELGQDIRVLSQEPGQDIRVLSQDPGQDIQVLSQDPGQEIWVLNKEPGQDIRVHYAAFADDCNGMMTPAHLYSVIRKTHLSCSRLNVHNKIMIEQALWKR